MIDLDSVVVLKNMDFDYSTGFHKPWMNGIIGKVISLNKVTNLNYGYTTTLVSIDLITPLISRKGNPITRLCGLNSRNVSEIVRVPISEGEC